MTEFYDDYLDSYGGDAPIPSIAQPGPDRVAAWARTNANPNYPLVRSGSRSQYAPSSYGGGGSLRRKVTKRNHSRTPSRVQSTYEEEEEGYVSGEYEDGTFELTLIRVKVYIVDLLLPRKF